MKRWNMLALAACLLLAGCGADNRETPEEGPPVQILPAAEETAEDWRAGYKAFLTELCRQEAAVRKIDRPDYDPNEYSYEIGMLSDGYCLYDIDKDGVPELLIRYGRSEAAYHTCVYGWADGAVTELDDFPSGHASLYTWPGENAVAYTWSHMGGHYVEKLSLTDGALTRETVFKEGMEDWAEEYTDMADIVPGCLELRPARTTLGLTFLEEADSAADQPLTLPIDDYGRERTAPEPDPARDEAARVAIQAVLDGETALIGVSADGFGGETGEMLLADYLAPGGVERYAEKTMRIARLAWADMDRDGQTECLLWLEHTLDDRFSGTTYVILSEQDGDVYAYCNNYCENYEVSVEGVFHHLYADDTFAVAFQKEQCYQYAVPYDGTVPPVEWEVFQ